ncbi:MAG: MaoC family dehydratase N-terminal domain-containing protein [Pseudomonadota bacterium]
MSPDSAVSSDLVTRIDAFRGRTYPPFEVAVHQEGVAAFAAAVGTTEDPVPPTYLFGLTIQAGQSFNVLDDMGVPHAQAVHGEQSFDYHAPVRIGDRLTGRQRIRDIGVKKDGALIIVQIETPLSRPDGAPVATLGSTIVIRAAREGAE